MRRLALVSALCITSFPAWADEQPVELGDVSWRRDYEAARTEAARAKRPLLILFDEVPG